MTDQPRPGVIYGLTHKLDGEPIVRLPRSTKVSIGIPAGKLMHCMITAKGNPAIFIGDKMHAFTTMDQAKAFWHEQWPNAPELKYPKRLDYFTFRRMSREGELEPDFEAIAAHGYRPTRIDIRFIDNAPWDCNLKWWGLGKLKCWGDGVNALRMVEFPTEKDHAALAKQAKDTHEKYFPIVGGCREIGCPLGHESSKNGKTHSAECKNYGRLGFLLEHHASLGSQSEYFTTGYRSVSQLSSSLGVIQLLVSGMGLSIRGIPLRLVLEPYKVTHDGKAQEQHAVRIELPAESLVGLKRKLMQSSADFHNLEIMALPVAPESATMTVSSDLPEMGEDDAEAFEAEFTSKEGEEPASDTGDDAETFTDPAETKPTPSESAAAATQIAQDGLRKRLKQSRQAKPAAATPPQAAQAPTAPLPLPEPAQEPLPEGSSFF